MKTDTGGPAFPSELYDEDSILRQTTGMTLLDYFAGQALEGELASQDFTPEGECFYANNDANREVMAEKSYLIAEAMIAEKRSREK